LLTGGINRIGDVFFLLFFGLACYGSSTPLCLFTFALLVVSFTKSAQVPFSSWLPAAMLAPTPVSALVHSSTLVTAGVYLLFRFYPLGSNMLLFVGIFTTLMAGYSAFYECDTKKIVALSTLSQLGLIVSSLGLGVRSFCFAHLNIHASFKALLFLSAGCIIHSVYGTQEVRASVPLRTSQPLLTLILVLSLASMCGLVFLSGFYSKEAILVAVYNSSSGLFSALLFYLGIGLTLGYSFRFMQMVVRAHCSSVPISVSAGLPPLAIFPLWWLLVCSLVQGSSMISTFSRTTRVLKFIDIIILYVILLIRFVVALIGMWSRSVSAYKPIFALGSRVTSATYFLLRPGTCMHTEQVHIHGLSASFLPSLIKPFSGAQHITAKAVLVLALVFFIV